jgi:hypothetical protein
MAGFAAAHGLDAFVISYTLLKNISASLKSGKTQTAPSADNRVARGPRAEGWRFAIEQAQGHC